MGGQLSVLMRMHAESVQNHSRAPEEDSQPDRSADDRQSGEVAAGPAKFPDLSELPAELGLEVLKHLDATDLCLAACVWQNLAEDEILWQGLCKDQWRYASVYRRLRAGGADRSYRHTYLQLDEGTLTFNADPFSGMQYFISRGLVDDDPAEIAMFLHSSSQMNPQQMRRYLDQRRDVMTLVMDLQNYRDQFLPAALRKLFSKVQPPEDRGNYLQTMLDKFSVKFCQGNPQLGLSTDTVYILCFSLIMLSVDLTSPHVKNKMSKREFIRNVRHAAAVDDVLSGHLYDDIYLRGHIAGRRPALGCR
ncbi:F-box only protein 8-like [Amphibalanus amphitrite]|uniref:F-box only protein 8-like n=1 Tax=Amphibalanus amphitrite TaxID=1232801 RepID=UPI001C90D421|nr:F-box only protein 8-like [Amphibalanus amphitrite]